MRLRPWREGDDLLPLWLAAWAAAMPEIDFPARSDWFRAHLAQLTREGAQVICAEAEGGLAGFVTVHSDSGHLDQLAVHPAWAGQGVAAALLDAAKAASPARLWLDVNQANRRAVALYRRAGFSTAGDGINPLSGLATWRMGWRLNEPEQEARLGK